MPILPSQPAASVLAVDTPTSAFDNTSIILSSDFNASQKAYIYGAYGSSYGAIYVKPNSTTGSEGNKTALHWPEFQSCKGVNFLVRKGNCYVVYSYTRNWQIAGVFFWGLFVALLGIAGVVAIVAILVAIAHH